MPNKLTDSEIKMALECCILGDCQGCFYGDTDQRRCRDDLMQEAICLINRQKIRIHQQEKTIMEIQNANLIDFKATIGNYIAENESLKAEVERLNNNISAMSTTLSTSARATRHEAYKECIEKVKAHYKECQFEYDYSNTCETLNNIYKELVGDDNSHNIDKQN